MSKLVTWSDQFKKDYKLAIKRNHNIEKLDNVIKLLAEGETLPPIYKDHNLAGFWKGFKECHIEPDWLLIYRLSEDKQILVLSRTGTHSDLFK